MSGTLETRRNVRNLPRVPRGPAQPASGIKATSSALLLPHPPIIGSGRLKSLGSGRLPRREYEEKGLEAPLCARRAVMKAP